MLDKWHNLCLTSGITPNIIIAYFPTFPLQILYPLLSLHSTGFATQISHDHLTRALLAGVQPGIANMGGFGADMVRILALLAAWLVKKN